MGVLSKLARHGVLLSLAWASAMGSALESASANAAAATGQGSVLARVRERGELRCGGVARPGLAEGKSSSAWLGLEVDVCRAIAAAVLGPSGRVGFTGYGSPAEFGRARDGDDDVVFLTGGEMASHRLAGSLLPGPVVFIASDAVMVPGDAPVEHVAQLGGKGICFMSGGTAEHGLEQFFDADRSKPWLRHPYSEPGEMSDAYAVGRCLAISGEATELARVRSLPSQARRASRILPEPLNVFPVVVATGTGDGKWSAIVAWVVHTLVDAERPERIWFAGGARSMPVDAAELGLEAGWQARAVAAAGDYGAIFERNLGQGGRLHLDRGLNANQLGGGLLLAPFVE